MLQQRLEAHKFSHIKDSTIEYTLRSPSSKGDLDKAYELLLLFEDARSGIVKEFNPDKKLLGAENREFTTCYIDSLLFAMFARLDSFESILSVEFPDHSKNTLAIVLRLWVNMMRGGKLITTDIVRSQGSDHGL